MPTRLVATSRTLMITLLLFYWWGPNVVAHGMLAASLEGLFAVT